MKKLFVIFLLILVGETKAQTDYKNHQKYWYYKSRLNNNFVNVGLNKGDSWPFNERSHGGSSNGGTSREMLLGDGTSTLGYYLGVLSTEYYLLKRNGQRTDSVRHELFCALNAFNMADAFAESQSTSELSLPTALNGFFIRDVVPVDYVRDNYKHFNYYTTWDGIINGSQWDGINGQPTTIYNDRGFGSVSQIGQVYTSSSFSSFEKTLADPNSPMPIKDNLYNLKYKTTFESQDQVYNLLLGLAMVSKFVDDTAKDYNINGTPRVFPYEQNGQVTTLHSEAKEISNRILRRLQNDGWRINYPGSNEMVFGGNADFFAYPLAEAGCFISGNGELPQSHSGSTFSSPKGCGGFITNNNDSYHNFWSSSKIAFELWNAYAKAPAFVMDQAAFVANLSAITNGVYGVSGGNWVQSTVSGWQQTPLLNVLGFIVKWVWAFVTWVVSLFLDFNFANTTFTTMTDNTSAWHLEYAPVARKILHPNSGVYYTGSQQQTVIDLINKAPCEGTYYWGNNEFGDYDWSVSNRCDKTNHLGGDDNFKGEYNGLDYMFYHNIWYIHKLQEGTGNNIYDRSDVYVNKNGGNLTGFTNPQVPFYNVLGYETITVENTTVNSGMNGEFRAGKAIHFKPGTIFQSNTNSHIYIDPWECSDERLPISNEKSTGLSVAIQNTSDAPWHHIDYPAEPIQMKQEPVKELNTNAINNTAVYEQEPSKAYQDSVMNSAMLAYVGGDAIMVNPVDENKAWKVYFYLHQGEFANIAVMDMKGNVIATENNLTQKDNGYKIDLSDKANGMYILKFIRSTGKEETKKLLRY